MRPRANARIAQIATSASAALNYAAIHAVLVPDLDWTALPPGPRPAELTGRRPRQGGVP